MKTKRDQPIRLIKRYGGCRLYDATAKRYVSPDDIERLTLEGVKVTVREAETGQEVTEELLPGRRMH
ncbi:hypothetical protein F6X53_24180 [Methylobacterium soli]|uniref:PHA accumulation regulator DNA-binding N-terminal domain-containing protein n=2 Tax=Methylobacterium soli TaxID=553447 RepID=A0A6L3SU65_9HYPH|nr:hypothetical protein F6X53_24180 [Methylobacterium soli]